MISSGSSSEFPAIVLDSVSMQFRTETAEVLALDGINLSVRKNEFLCIVGASGCGKTTILNLIAGFLTPTTGRVVVGGRPVAGPGPDRVVVFQNDAVFPWMTVEQNIGFSQRVRGKPEPEIQAVVDRYLSLVHLEDFRKAWPKELSGGMRKRVDLARGYAADPEVLLLDEPFGALDLTTKEYLQEELHKLWLAAPRTIVFITHDLDEALFLGDRVVAMTPRPGKIAAVYEPNLPRPRDMSFKVEETFIQYSRELRRRFLNRAA